MVEPLRTVLIIVGSSIVYLILTMLIACIASRRLRAQLASVLGHRHLEVVTDANAYVIYLFPLRGYEQVFWPIWLPVVLIMKLIGMPAPKDPLRNKETERRA